MKNVFKIYLNLLLFLVYYLGFCSVDAHAQKEYAVAYSPILHLTIGTTINPATAEYVHKGLINAESQHLSAVIISLNTPGGLITSMQSIVEEILRSKVPVFVYVSPSGGGAISAGVFITMAGHIAAMAPGTTIGAAHPVNSNGENIGDDMRNKAENFAASLVRAIAEQRGRNINWAEKAVRESVALTDIEAIKEKVVDFSADNIQTIFEKSKGKIIKLDGKDYTIPDYRGVQIIEFPMSFQQRVVSAVSDPNVMAILGLLAMGGIMAELYNPGLILPGLVGVISLILTLVASQTIPISMGGAALLLLGAILISTEIFLPSFGLFGIAGIVSLVIGAIYAIDTSQVWANEGFMIDPWLIGSVAAILGVLLVALVNMVISTKRTRVTTSSEGLVGARALVDREFSILPSRPNTYSGKVKLKGEIWNAYIDIQQGAPKIGSEVFIEKVEGLTLKVKL